MTGSPQLGGAFLHGAGPAAQGEAAKEDGLLALLSNPGSKRRSKDLKGLVGYMGTR